MNERNFDLERKRMVDEQIARRGIKEPRLLDAIQAVPRHRFVPEESLTWAYSDGPLPIGYGQTISQPYIVALMTEMLQLTGSERVLEVGTGSGYQSAVLAHLVEEVHTVEIIPELVKLAKRILKELGLINVRVHQGDGSLGWPQASPYHAILVAAAAPDVPKPLLEQLAEGGRLVLPVGGSYGFQQLETWQRCGTKYKQRGGIPVAFVPLRGKHGWRR